MIKSVALEFHWPPDVLSGLFFGPWTENDEHDIHSLKYWFNTIQDLKPKKKK